MEITQPLDFASNFAVDFRILCPKDSSHDEQMKAIKAAFKKNITEVHSINHQTKTIIFNDESSASWGHDNWVISQSHLSKE